MHSQKTAALVFCITLAAVQFYIGLLSKDIKFERVPDAYGVAPNTDAEDYHRIAVNYRDGCGISLSRCEPNTRFAPAHPLLLGWWYSITGDASLHSGLRWQGIIHALGCVAVFYLFLEFQLSTLAACVLAVSLGMLPPFMARATNLLYEPEITLFTLVALVLSLRLIRGAETQVLTGAAWGIATLTKVVGWFGAPLLACFLPRRQAWTLLIAYALTLAPWTLRNYLVSGELIIVNKQGAIIEGIMATSRHPFKIVDDMNTWQYKYLERPLVNALYLTYPDFHTCWYSAPLKPPARLYRSVSRIFWVLILLPLYIVFAYRITELNRMRPGYRYAWLFVAIYFVQYALIWGEPRFMTPVFPLMFCFTIQKYLLPDRTEKIKGSTTAPTGWR